MKYVSSLIEIGATEMITFTSPLLPKLLLLKQTLSVLPSACKAQEKQQLTCHKVVHFPTSRKHSKLNFAI